jgi:hypothetical protein
MFEQRSFLSVVAYNPAKDIKDSEHKAIAEASEEPKGGWLLVRARLIEDLEAVQTRVGQDIFIRTDRYADYSFRALMSRELFKEYLSLAVDDIDYGAHFKEASRAVSAHSAARYSAMMSVWSTMAALQPYTPYAGTERKSTPKASNSWSGTTYGADTSKVTSVTTSTGTDYYGSEDYRNEAFYDRLFNEYDSARDPNSPDHQTVQFDADDDEWYNYAGVPAGKPKSVPTGTTKTATTTKPVVSSKGWSPAKPLDLTFYPSTYWFDMSDLRKHLTTGGTLATLTDDDVDSMQEDTWLAWSYASHQYDVDSILTANDIERICGPEGEAENTEEGVSNE